MNTEYIAGIFVLALVVVLIILVGMLRRAGRSDSFRQAGEQARLAEELASEREVARQSMVDAGQLRGRLETLQRELEGERARSDAQQLSIAELAARIERETAVSAEREARLVERDEALAVMRRRMAELEALLDQQRTRYQELHGEHAQAMANLRHSQRAEEDMRAYLDAAKEKLSGVFSELAGKVFEERGQQFEKNVRLATVQSRADIEGLLKPFSEKLGEFRTRVDDLYGAEARERASLLGAVGELKTLNQDMASQAAALTGALKGSARVRGDWGELMLDNVLRGSGLEEGVHYQRQQHAVDEEGARLRPDVVVRFPDNRSVVIDSKVNLIAWQEAMNAETPEQHEDALRRHAIGLRQHVKDLGEKNYPKALGADALEVTIAFVPIEGALSAALGADASLQTYAFDRKVVFASPNTLMALLRVTERLWTRDKVQRQALEISEVGGRVLDSLMAFLSDFDNVGKRLDEAAKAFGSARGRLSESSQSVIQRARRLAELGSKAKKALPAELEPETIQQLTSSDPE